MLTRRSIPQGSSSFGWFLAATLGAVAWWLPRWELMPLDRSTMEVVSHLALLFSGALVAALCPGQPWRWGVASFFAIAITDVVLHLASTPSTAGIEAKIWAYASVNALSWALHSIPVIVGAYVGALLYHAGLR